MFSYRKYEFIFHFYFAVEFLKTQFKHLKDNYKKCLDRQNRASKSGSAASKVSKCKYYDQLTFLFDKTANLPTESNIAIPTIPLLMQDADSPRSIEETQESTPLTPLTPIDISSQPKGLPKRKALSPSEFTPPPGKAVKSGKGKNDLGLAVDTMLIKTLQDIESQGKPVEKKEETNGDSLFCQSLVLNSSRPLRQEEQIRKNENSNIIV